jgi:hypothetical protein
MRPDGAPARDNVLPTTGATAAEGFAHPTEQPLSGVPQVVPASETASAAEPIPTPPTIEAIAAENERLRRELAAERARARHPPVRRVRRTAVGVLVVLSCLGVLLSSVTVWTHQTFLDTNNWVALVGPLAQNPKVVSAVSSYTADQVVTALDVQTRAQEALPPRAQFLAVPLTKVVHDFTQNTVAKLMRTSQFQQVWIATNRLVHSEVLAALRGDTKNVIISNGTVTLNLIPIIDQALQALEQQISGLLPGNIKLPDPSQLKLPAQARAKLSQALGVPLPTNFGEIVLFHSDQLAKAQRILQLFDFLTVALPILTFLLLAATIWLSIDRRRTLIQLGIGLAITFLIARIVVGYIVGRVIDGISNPTAQGIAGEVITSAVDGLLTLTVLLLVAGLVVGIVAYLFGKPEWFAAAYAGGRSGYTRARIGLGHAREELDRRRHDSTSQASQQATVLDMTTTPSQTRPGETASTTSLSTSNERQDDLPPGAVAHGA